MFVSIQVCYLFFVVISSGFAMKLDWGQDVLKHLTVVDDNGFSDDEASYERKQHFRVPGLVCIFLIGLVFLFSVCTLF